jgi:hypothetical protein
MNIAISIAAGFGTGVIAWFLAMHFVAKWLVRTGDREPGPEASRALRIQEVIACGLVFAASLTLALWLSWLVWLQVKD